MSIVVVFAYCSITVVFGKSKPITPEKSTYFSVLEQKDSKIYGEILGADDRQEITSDLMPWSAIGQVQRYDEQWKKVENRGPCTGALVAAYYVITNTHCVLNAKHIRFFPNVRSGQHTLYSDGELLWKGETESAKDWAIIRLKSPLGKLFGWLGMYNASLEELTSAAWQKKLVLGGYSGDYKNGSSPTAHVGCSVTGSVPNGITHDCDMWPGASGSPLIAQFPDKEGFYMVGLNWGQTRTYNLGVLMGKFYDKMMDILRNEEKHRSADFIPFHICNWSAGGTVGVGIGKWNGPDGAWDTSGWTNVGRNTCWEFEVPPQYNEKAQVYYHAYSGQKKWGKDLVMCVGLGDSYRIRSADKGNCPNNAHKVKFSGLGVETDKMNTMFLSE